jgi:GH18 family chitinase
VRPGVGLVQTAVGGAPGACTASAGTLSYYEIQWMVQSTQYDDAMMVAYGVYAAGSSWVGFDNARTLGMKVCYARAQGLGGLMVWDGEMDNDLVLIKGVRAAMGKAYGASCSAPATYLASSC